MQVDSIIRTVVIGNEANLIKQSHKSSDDPTHRWRVFVHGPDNEDITTWVKQIHFELHETFNNPTRVRVNKPFEVEERGWGEFDIQVTIFVKGHENYPFVFTHPLRLHSTRTKKGKPDYPFFSCSYQNLVFKNLSNETLKFLESYPQTPNRPLLRGQEPEQIEVYPSFEGESSYNDAHKDVKLKIQNAMNLYLQTQKEIEKTKQDILQLEEQQNYIFGNSNFVQRPLKDVNK